MIAAVELTLFAVEGLAPLHYAHGLSSTAGRVELGLLRLRCNDGMEGIAFLGSPMRSAGLDARALIEGAAPLVLGADPLARERLLKSLNAWGRSNGLRAVGALDAALWDLAGKRAGLPLHRLLGGFRESIPAYASSPRLGDVEAYVEQAVACRAEGYAGYKIHPPGTPEADLAVCRAVRQALGAEWPLMLDASFAYRLPEAVRVGRAIEEMGFRWLEDPLGEYDLQAYPELRAKLAIPVMATEMPMLGLESYAPWVVARGTDFLRGDVPLKGGITPMLKAAHLAEAFGLPFEVHHGGNSVNNLAGLHLALAIPNTSFFEVLLPVTSHRLGLVEDITMDSAGHVRPPEGPGLGAVPDMALIARHRIGELSARCP